eukprot:GHVR01015653.1.p1 GENE.GHVR01015653.1~~GHVR01015653.1.p1  ORF type:complete len:115 (+),score=97.21 GHVR01015653.1:2-346(+)
MKPLYDVTHTHTDTYTHTHTHNKSQYLENTSVCETGSVEVCYWTTIVMAVIDAVTRYTHTHTHTQSPVEMSGVIDDPVIVDKLIDAQIAACESISSTHTHTHTHTHTTKYTTFC